MTRCDWADSSPAMQHYHDTEWGQPVHNQQQLFELLCLETYQAGLSWQTVLNKRAAFNEDFYNYDIERVAAMTAADVDRLLTDARIIRHRQKLMATINNAQIIRDWPLKQSYSAWLWQFVNDQPIRQAWTTSRDLPPTTTLAIEISKAMKKLGFKFVGPTTIYAYLQGAGLVNDHLASCDWAPEHRKTSY
ncbi:DNA-3-methyladenine glycosylase I [Lactobacillus sp. CBA3605]|uniref:DNA-3-methyladenine glycosylase I n=1 Tax=Lactobacillus sp. CBA3605 TaxID=2099788 RepID=UPI000CFD0589|nr:DNA-3-methyladenine glycosylase I [Lactobacillus sp. CBA3605]AVK61715.1 DNA-3-methyladenine glycosylase I [Lactobacillus sp. CBA3605]